MFDDTSINPNTRVSDVETKTPVIVLYGSFDTVDATFRFFEAMGPSNPWIFLIIIDLPSDSEDAFVSQLQNATRMQVVRVGASVKLVENRVYLLPTKDVNLDITGDSIHVTHAVELSDRTTVDQLWRKLAVEFGSRLSVIVLLGKTIHGVYAGINRIKEQGGLAIAQSPGEAELDRVSQSAISTGLIDWVLSIGEMPSRLQAYYKTETDPRLVFEQELNTTGAVPALRELLSYLRTRTDRDFSYYKLTTILRRVGRRIKINGLEDIRGYLMYLRMHPDEVTVLLKELSPSAPRLYRDREAFAALEFTISQLFAGKSANDTVRVWIPGCGTGEEAYLIAALLYEFARKMDAAPFVQVFATDLDEHVIFEAREGLCTTSFVEDMSNERLRHYFVLERGGYRARREIRELISFVPQDLLKDAPFTRLDLISCRNLLIYLTKEAQQKVFEIFHYALNSNGLLLLGSTDSVADDSDYFVSLNKRFRLYQRRTLAVSPSPIVPGQWPVKQNELPYPPVVSHWGLPSPTIENAFYANRKIESQPRWEEAHFKSLERFGPPSLIINQKREVLHSARNAGAFLQIAGGEPSRQILDLILPALRDKLNSALFTVEQSGQPTETSEVANLHGRQVQITICAIPIDEVIAGGILLIFDNQPLAQDRQDESRQYIAPVSQGLESEIERITKQLRDRIAQYNFATEQLRISNEELEATNEELRVATADLQDGRVELQSMNEHLGATNQQLKRKIEELGVTNNDLQNLMASTDIATIFLDRDLRITRFTPRAVDLFNLIPGDVGRPLANLTHKLRYTDLSNDIGTVVRTSLPMEIEVGESGGRWFLVRILPYQANGNPFAGVVLTFVDITQQYRAEQALKRKEERLCEINSALDERVQERTRELVRSEEKLRDMAETSERRAQQLQSLTNELMTAEHRERRRIATILHDHIQQILVATRIQVQEIERGRSKTDRARVITKVTGMIDESIDAVRTLSVELVPPLLYDEGLVGALEWLAGRMQEQHYLQVIVESSLFVEEISSESRDLLFQASRELLLNIIKHAKTNRAVIRISNVDGGTQLEVNDFGCGFDLKVLEQKQPTFGLYQIRERIDAVGGSFSINSANGAGTHITIILPAKNFLHLTDGGRDAI